MIKEPKDGIPKFLLLECLSQQQRVLFIKLKLYLYFFLSVTKTTCLYF